MEKTMKILQGQMLDIYERFYRYEIRKQNIQLNDSFAEIYNPTYDITAYQNIGNGKQRPD
jgi:hypothetical protein